MKTAAEWKRDRKNLKCAACGKPIPLDGIGAYRGNYYDVDCFKKVTG